MTSYVSRIIPNFAMVTEPLRRLTRANNPWSCGTEQEKALKELHTLLQSETTMAYYDPMKHTELIVDASPVGLGAILAQKENKEDGGGRIVAYVSRGLSDVESQYSQLEREALAIAWATEKFHLYIYGRPIEIFTDHRPLEALFNNPRSKPNARIERWLIKMQDRYDLKVIYRPGKNPENPADYLSRHAVLPSSKASKAAIEAEQYVNLIEMNAIPKTLSVAQVKNTTMEDATLQAAITNVKQGCWNEQPHQVNMEALKNLKRLKDELTITSDGLLLKGTKLVIQKKLQMKVVEHAHQGHQGIVKTKRLIREKVWFPGIDELVEDKIQNCLACQASTLDSKAKYEPLIMSELPDGPWQKVDIDFCGPFPSGDYLLVAMDEYSRFPEIEITKSTSAHATVPKLDKIFSVHKVPEEVKSDNGPPFQSEDFKHFAEYLGFHHRKITPGYPQANGEVDMIYVNVGKNHQVCHRRRKTMEAKIVSIPEKLSHHTSTGIPPATALFNRSIRSTLPEVQKRARNNESLRAADAKSKHTMKEYADKRRNAAYSSIQPGDTVLVKQEKANKYSTPFNPRPYEVTARKGNMITAENGEHKVTCNASKFKGISPKFQADVYTPDEEQPEIDREEVNLNADEAAENVPHKSPTKYSADVSPSRYPTRSTRNKKPALMNEYQIGT